jgi:hypothetical protein
MATILNTTQVYAPADYVTSTNLNQIIAGSTFVVGAGGTTDDTTLEVDATSGSIQVKPNGIGTNEIGSGVVTLSNLASSLIDSLYPVGSIYSNATDGTDPSTLLGFGTWVSFGEGRVLVGGGTGTDDQPTPEVKTFTAGDTGGEYNHTLTEDEIPSHNHTINNMLARNIYDRDQGGGGYDPNNPGSILTELTGGDLPHNNIQPYITVYMWTRTA